MQADTPEQPDTPEITELKAANQRFYDAFGALDIEMMDDVWDQSEKAMCVHPGWPALMDWEMIRQSWDRIFQNTSLMLFNIRSINAVVVGDCGWVTCTENISSVLQGTASNFGILATNIFVRTPEGWRMIAHHASPGA